MNKLTATLCVFALFSVAKVHAAESVHEPGALIYWTMSFGGGAKDPDRFRYGVRLNYAQPPPAQYAFQLDNPRPQSALIDFRAACNTIKGVTVHKITVAQQGISYTEGGKDTSEPTDSFDWPIALGIGASIGLLAYVAVQLL
ncbi:MAG: hypothetical protein L0Y67_06150 [Gammaproteobacteria bacterium]|nr:hypothetical protein [Gammaproteobacteria bacterium]MCI0591168.1 hypothetical protein [Gammaproteobacteria bacterium]